MTFDEYQKKAITTDISIRDNKGIESLAFMDKILGLTGEAGEVADKFKKMLRDKNNPFLNPDERLEVVKEIGDVLWYISAIAGYLDVSFDDVAELNLKKVLDRKNRGMTGGAGDNR